MADRQQILYAGNSLVLDADRALYWPALRRLLIADLHLGKGDIFRSAGIAVPTGGTAHDLARIEHLLQRYEPLSLWILGDVVHGSATRRSTFADAFRALTFRWPAVEFAVLAGNHDRSLDAAALGLQLLPPWVEEQGIVLAHEASPLREPSISGHVHPVIKLPGELRQWPVFWRSGSHLVLPAFSNFTGGFRVCPRHGEALYACDGQSIVELVPMR